MAVKTYKLRLDFHSLEKEQAENPTKFPNRAVEVRQGLWDTHVAFNEGVAYLTRALLQIRRGAGIWREKKDGIWGEWKPIRTAEELDEVKTRRARDGSNLGLIENAVLIDRLSTKSGDRRKAVRSAATCSAIFESLCPTPSQDDPDGGGLVQMERDSLDLLTNSGSCARGIRQPPWIIDRVAAALVRTASSYEELIERFKVDSRCVDSNGLLSEGAVRTLKKLQKLKRGSGRRNATWDELAREI